LLVACLDWNPRVYSLARWRPRGNSASPVSGCASAAPKRTNGTVHTSRACGRDALPIAADRLKIQSETARTGRAK
jgi:hypothetical protein